MCDPALMNDQQSAANSHHCEHVEMLEVVRAQIARDAAAGRFACWGSSTLIDEFTRVATIDRALSEELHRAAGLASEFPIGNAGLLHVYGYWFSEVPTPFGFKRDRWQQGELAGALGLPRDAFHLEHTSGRTLLDRVQAEMLPLLRRPPAQALHAEAVVSGKLTRAVVCGAGQDTPAALIYGLASSSQAQADELSLITAFPVVGDPTPLLTEFQQHPSLRWNAVNYS